MPLLRIYRCEACNETRTSIDSSAIPLCPGCRGPMAWKQTRDYHPENHGWATGMKAPAIDFNQTAGRVAPIGDGVPINSLHDIRRIERESEQRARNGEGEQYVFRKYQQDRGNLYTHTLGEAPQAAPSQDWLRKHAQEFGDLIAPMRADEAEAAATLGPGMTADQPTPFGD